MKKSELVKIIREELNSINKPVLTEAFKNTSVAKFFDMLRSSKDITRKYLPQGMGAIAWSEVPQDAAKLVAADAAVKYTATDEYIIFWLSTQKKTVKHVPPTWTKHGYKRDNNKYIHPGLIAVSKKRNFQTPIGGAYKDIEAGWEKPAGIGSVKQLLEFADYALVVNISALTDYSARGKQDARSSARMGALVLQSADRIKSDNLQRYREAIKLKSADKRTEKLDKPVAELMNGYLQFVKELAQKVDKIEDVNKLAAGIKELDPIMSGVTSLFKTIKTYAKDAEEFKGSTHSRMGDYYENKLKEYMPELETKIEFANKTLAKVKSTL